VLEEDVNEKYLAIFVEELVDGIWMKLNDIMFILTGLYWKYLCKFFPENKGLKNMEDKI
jgi:hypothetical protein